MILSLIVATSENDIIGRDGELPWHLPNDLKYFRKVTLGHPVIMGRKTYESIGHPLPKRQNIVITRNEDFISEECDIVHSLDQALSIVNQDVEEVFVIGGGQIFELALPQAQRVYLTRVHTVIQGDAIFPELDEDEWREVSREIHPDDERHEYAFSFLIFERR